MYQWHVKCTLAYFLFIIIAKDLELKKESHATHLLLIFRVRREYLTGITKYLISVLVVINPLE